MKTQKQNTEEIKDRIIGLTKTLISKGLDIEIATRHAEDIVRIVGEKK